MVAAPAAVVAAPAASAAPAPATPVAPAPVAPVPPRRSRLPGCLLGCLIVGLIFVGVMIGGGVWLYRTLAGQVKRTLVETVSYAAAQGGVPAAPAGVEFSPYVNSAHGFSSELPTKW